MGHDDLAILKKKNRANYFKESTHLLRTTFNPDQYNQTINDRNQEIQSNVNVEKTLQVATKEMGDYENIITENKKKIFTK